MKFKAIPSAKTKRTYLLLEAKGRGEVEKVILDYLGILGWAKASPIFVEGGRKDGRIILAINRGEINHIRAALRRLLLK